MKQPIEFTRKNGLIPLVFLTIMVLVLMILLSWFTPAGKIYQHRETVRIAKIQASKRNATAVTKYAKLATQYNTELNSLAKRYAHSGFVTTVDLPGQKPIRHVIAKISDLHIAVLKLPDVTKNYHQLKNQVDELADYADDFSTAVSVN